MASLNVSVADGCAWQASSNASWITITSGASGNGTGTVVYTVSTNGTGSGRKGKITVAGAVLVVKQKAT